MSPKPTKTAPNGPDKHSPERSAAVLLVEHDDGVRRLLFWSLYIEGLKVLTARDTADAQRLSRDVPGPIEILIVGSLPPGSDSKTLREQLETERPELRTILLADIESSVNAAPPGNKAGISDIRETVSPGVLVANVKNLLRRQGT